MIYYVLFSLLLLFAFAERFSTKKIKFFRRWFYFFVVVFYLLGSLRWERGTDWSAYYYFFLNPWTWWDNHYEIGYTFLNRLVRKITDNYTVFLCVQNAIYYIVMIHVYNNIQNNEEGENSTFFLLLLYSFAQGLAGMYSTRTQVASILCLSAYCDLTKGRNVRFLAKTLVASAFHLMAIVFLAAFFINRFRGTYKQYLRVLFIVTIVVMVSPTIVSSIMVRIPAFSRYVSMYIHTNSGSLNILGIAQWGLLLLAFIYSKRFSTYKYYDTCLMLYTLGFAMYIWAAEYSYYFNRVAGIFLGTSIFMIPAFFKAFKGKQALFLFGMYGLYCFLAFYTFLNGEYSVLFLPYKSIFDEFAVISDI